METVDDGETIAPRIATTRSRVLRWNRNTPERDDDDITPCARTPSPAALARTKCGVKKGPEDFRGNFNDSRPES